MKTSKKNWNWVTTAAAVLLTICTANAANYDKMIVFGDSLSDIGNFSALAGPGLLSSYNYEANRFTDGPMTTPATSVGGLVVEQLDAQLHLPSLTAWYDGGNDYAFARATTTGKLPDLALGEVPGTGVQIFSYLQQQKASPDSLYVIWAGANDLFNATTVADIQLAETNAISNLSLEVSTLLSAGARNVLWFDIPDLSLTPGGMAEGTVLAAQLHQSSLQFRTDWLNTIAQLKTLFPSAEITGVDAYAILHSIVANPLDYGLSNVTDPAQGQASVNPDQFLFWDGVHPTTRADSFVADLAFRALQPALQPVPEPSTYGSIAAVALLGLAVVRRRAAVVSSRINCPG